MTATTTLPRQLDRAAFVARIRGLLNQGLPHEQIIERMNPVRSMSVTEAFLRTAVKDIASALEIAADVSAPKLAQSRRDFINYTRHADEHDHVASNAAAQINRMYPDAPIRAEKLKVLRAEQERRRAMADQAAADWQSIQLRRATFDAAVQAYSTAFTVEDRKPWEPKPVK